MAKTKILNRAPVQPKPKIICPNCDKVHYSQKITIYPEAKRLCDICYKKYLEERKKNG